MPKKIDHRYIANIGVHTHTEIDAFMAGGIGGGSDIRPFKYVVDQGGKGDFTTITEALNALGTNPGEIKLREGDFPAETWPVTLNPYQSLVGAGAEATIITPDFLSTGSVIQLTPSYIGGQYTIPFIKIADLSIDGKNTTGNVSGIFDPSGQEGLYCRAGVNLFQNDCNTGYGSDGTRKILQNIRIWNMSGRGVDFNGNGNITFYVVEVAQCGRTGIYLTPYGNHGTMYSCICEMNGRANISGDNYGYFLDNAQAIMITNSYSIWNQGHNFYAKATTPGSCDQLTMLGCLSEASLAGDEVRIDGYDVTRIIGGSHASNYRVVGTAALRFLNMKHSQIIGNNVNYGAYDGIYIDGCERCNISFNDVNTDVIDHIPIYLNGGDRIDLISNKPELISWGILPTNSMRFTNEVSNGSGVTINVALDNTHFETYRFFDNGDIQRNSDSKKVVWA